MPERPIEFVALPEEEGARFGGGLFASRAMCGQLYENELESYKDSEGVSMAQAMWEYGLDPAKADEARRKKGEIGMFLELHIEQGPVLEKEKVDVGIVEAIVGIKCFNVYVYGRSDHAGTTPLNMRADTMLATARAIVAGTDKAKELDDGTVVTFGRVGRPSPEPSTSWPRRPSLTSTAAARLWKAWTRSSPPSKPLWSRAKPRTRASASVLLKSSPLSRCL